VGDSIEVEEGEVVEGDAVAVGGSARVAGTVMGDLVAIGGSVHLLPTADVRGEVVCVGGKITRDEGSKVGGEIVSVGPGFPWGHKGREHRGGGLRTATLVFFMIGVFSGLAALIVYSIWGSKIEGMAALVPTETLRFGLIGLVAWLLAPWACILLVITCVGVFFVPLFLVLLLFAIVAGLATIYLTVGAWGARGRFDVSSPVGTMLIGMVIVHGLSVFGAFIGGFIPIMKPIGIAVFVFGLVVLGIAGTLGLGAVLYTRFGKRHMPATGTATPPPPPPFTAGATGPESVGV
jgi:hypothetical protein